MAQTSGAENDLNDAIEDAAVDHGLFRGEPGVIYSYTTPAGSNVDLIADDGGVVKPTSAAEKQVLMGFGLEEVKEVADGHGGKTTRRVAPAAAAKVESTAGAEENVTPAEPADSGKE